MFSSLSLSLFPCFLFLRYHLPFSKITDNRQTPLLGHGADQIPLLRRNQHHRQRWLFLAAVHILHEPTLVFIRNISKRTSRVLRNHRSSYNFAQNNPPPCQCSRRSRPRHKRLELHRRFSRQTGRMAFQRHEIAGVFFDRKSLVR